MTNTATGAAFLSWVGEVAKCQFCQRQPLTCQAFRRPNTPRAISAHHSLCKHSHGTTDPCSCPSHPLLKLFGLANWLLPCFTSTSRGSPDRPIQVSMAKVNQLRQIHTEHFKQESRMKSFLTQKSVSVDVWCRVQKFCRLRILLDKMSLKEGAAWLKLPLRRHSSMLNARDNQYDQVKHS